MLLLPEAPWVRVTLWLSNERGGGFYGFVEGIPVHCSNDRGQVSQSVTSHSCVCQSPREREMQFGYALYGNDVGLPSKPHGDTAQRPSLAHQ